MNKKTESKFYIGIDNGVTGSIGIVGKELTYYEFMETPITFGQDYTKAKKNVSRVNVTTFAEVIHTLKGYGLCVAVLERPMKNPARFDATCSAMRALEAELTVLELYDVPYMFIDSKEWQKEMLPKGVVGTKELKKASLDIGKRLFPEIKNKHPDRDGILIAEYARRRCLL